MKYMLIFSLLFMLTSCDTKSTNYNQATANNIPAICQGRHLLTIGYNGEVVSGSKTALSTAVIQGTPIYVGWALDWDNDGIDDVTHWHDAVFLSVFGGEVFTQTPRIEAQAPIKDPSRISFGPSGTEWVGALGTNGKMTNRFGATGKPNTKKARSWWCTKQ